MAPNFGEVLVVSLSQETKHEKLSKIRAIFGALCVAGQRNQ